MIIHHDFDSELVNEYNTLKSFFQQIHMSIQELLSCDPTKLHIDITSFVYRITRVNLSLHFIPTLALFYHHIFRLQGNVTITLTIISRS